jgi:hypothetical protein
MIDRWVNAACQDTASQRKNVVARLEGIIDRCDPSMLLRILSLTVRMDLASARVIRAAAKLAVVEAKIRRISEAADAVSKHDEQSMIVV